MRITAIVLLLVSACLAFFTVTNSSTGENIVITITTDDLRREFEVNPTEAEKRYTGKTLQVTGIVFERAQPKDNIPKKNASYLAFGDYDKDEVLLLCYFDTVHATSQIKRQDTVTLQGKFDMFSQKGLKMIILRECKINP